MAKFCVESEIAIMASAKTFSGCVERASDLLGVPRRELVVDAMV
jgi:hypothetical protein